MTLKGSNSCSMDIDYFWIICISLRWGYGTLEKLLHTNNHPEQNNLKDNQIHQINQVHHLYNMLNLVFTSCVKTQNTTYFMCMWMLLLGHSLMIIHRCRINKSIEYPEASIADLIAYLCILSLCGSESVLVHTTYTISTSLIPAPYRQERLHMYHPVSLHQYQLQWFVW